MRTSIFVFVVAVAFGVRAAEIQVQVVQAVDLDQPGALQRLRATRPADFQAASEILQAARRMPCNDREVRVIQAKFDVRRLSCFAMLLTSFPAQRRLSFDIGEVTYAATVRLDAERLGTFPAEPAR
jgi:hypothetical protein